VNDIFFIIVFIYPIEESRWTEHFGVRSLSDKKTQDNNAPYYSKKPRKEKTQKKRPREMHDKARGDAGKDKRGGRPSEGFRKGEKSDEERRLQRDRPYTDALSQRQLKKTAEKEFVDGCLDRREQCVRKEKKESSADASVGRGGPQSVDERESRQIGHERYDESGACPNDLSRAGGSVETVVHQSFFEYESDDEQWKEDEENDGGYVRLRVFLRREKNEKNGSDEGGHDGVKSFPLSRFHSF
jgi:hypothetical protein